jgi:hypothetical protein
LTSAGRKVLINNERRRLLDDAATPDLSLLLEFDSSDPLFARGFEAGRLWATLRVDPDEVVEEYLHASNLEMLLRSAEAAGRQVRTTDVDETWVLATFEAAESIDSD